MSNTFINPVVNPDTSLGVNAFTEALPIQHWQTGFADQIETVIRAAYKQVFGNAYVMESERVRVAESQFRQGDLTVTEFVRKLAKSELYRSRFFENSSRNRFIELNFKHLLGRAPESQAEIAMHSAILDSHGYGAEIDSYINSDEYQETFGSETVPYYRGYKTEGSARMVGFTHIFPLLRGASSSDKTLTTDNPARLTRALFTGQASSVVPPSGAKNRRGYGGTSSTDDLLRDLFNRPAAASSASKPETKSSATSEFAQMGDSELATKSQEQSNLIEALEKQLNEVRSLSNMGAAILRKGQRPTEATAERAFGTQGSPFANSNAGLSDQVAKQAEKIEKLRGELMSARSLATIAESKLNRWRQRSF